MANNDVFISYASSDHSAAVLVCNRIEERGITCWIAPRHIEPSADWPTAIVHALKASKLVVLVFSSSANESRQVMRELAIAVDSGHPIIPFRIEHVAPTGALEYFVSVTQWLDAIQPPLEQHIARLLDRVEALLASESRWTPPSAVISLRLFVESLAMVSEETWNKVEVVERAYTYGGFREHRPEHPEVINAELVALESLASQDAVSLDDGWQEEYWRTGYVRAICSDRKHAVQAFLRAADDQLLRLVDVFRTPTNFTREGLRRKGIAGTFDREATEQLIEKCVRAGLLSEGMPGGPAGSHSYFRDMRHKPKALLYDLGRLVDMCGVQVQEH